MQFRKTSLLKALDASAGALLCRLMGRIAYAFEHTAALHEIENSGIQKLLIIRPGGIGDMIVLLPVISEIRKALPNTEIDVICETRNSKVLDLFEIDVNQLVYDARPLEALKKLKNTSYDLAIDTEQFHNFSAVLAYWCGAQRRIGFKVNPRRNALYTDLVGYDQDAPEIEQFSNLLRPLGIKLPPLNLCGKLSGMDPGMSQALKHKISQCAGKKNFALLHVGGSTTNKRWPTHCFAELTDRIASELDLAPLLIGDKKDFPVASAIKQLCTSEPEPCNLCGKMSFSDAAGLIKKGQLFVGTDSGLAHAAAALDVPSVVLFGPSDENKWGTKGRQHKVVRVKLPCSPCSIFGYTKPCRHNSCMKKITPDQVIKAAKDVLFH